MKRGFSHFLIFGILGVNFGGFFRSLFGGFLPGGLGLLCRSLLWVLIGGFRCRRGFWGNFGRGFFGIEGEVSL